MRHIVLFFLLCLCSPLQAQEAPPAPQAAPQAVLEAPETAFAGDLVIVGWGNSTGNAFLLVPPESLKGKILLNSTDKQLGFSTRTPGDYRFVMIATREPEISYLEKIIRITNPTPGPIPPGPVPVPPTPTPIPSGWEDLKELSARSAAQINDPPTTQALRAAIEGILPQLANAPSLTNAYALSSFTIENTLLRRSGPSLKKDWINGWRKPISAFLNKAEIDGRFTTPSGFADAMFAAASGLQ